MICKDINIEIDSNTPFKNDKLNRYGLARNLTKMAKLFSDTGAVLALDGDWGVGKTTFVKMWKQELINNGSKCIYFNAWEADFQEDPFIALMSELNSLFNQSDGFKDVVALGAKIALKTGGDLIKGFVKTSLGIDSVAIKSIVDETIDHYKEKISDFQEQKESIKEFKEKLGEFVSSESNGNPVFFFIDELDRCNPYFAVKLLERVKHLYEVPNIIFVLSVNINQLQYAIQGFYGSSNINGREYLKRFIDIEYTMPLPDLGLYCDFLYYEYELDTFFDSNQRKYHRYLQETTQEFHSIAKDLIIASQLNLRIINRIYSHTRLSLCCFDIKCKFSGNVFFLLCFLKETNPSFYSAIKNGEFSIQDLLTKLEAILPNSILINTDINIQRSVAVLLASFLVKYNAADGNRVKRDATFINRGTESEPDFHITTSKLNIDLLNEELKYYSKEQYPGYSFNSILAAIDLASDFQIN